MSIGLLQEYDALRDKTYRRAALGPDVDGCEDCRRFNLEAVA